MHRPLLIALSVLSLAACTAQPASPAGSAASSASSAETVTVSGPVTLELKQSTVVDEYSVPLTKASLVLTGGMNRTIDLGDIQGELQLVTPAGYARFADAVGGETIAAFTTWFAGQGEEIWVTRYAGNPEALTVQHRYGDESGFCNPPGLLADLAFPASATLAVNTQGLQTTERSTIDAPCTNS